MKEIIIYFCETTGQGIAHEVRKEFSKSNLEYAEAQFNMWSNCYMVKVRTTCEDGMFSDEVICKRNIEL